MTQVRAVPSPCHAAAPMAFLAHPAAIRPGAQLAGRGSAPACKSCSHCCWMAVFDNRCASRGHRVSKVYPPPLSIAALALPLQGANRAEKDGGA